jgi:hypothetical protein
MAKEIGYEVDVLRDLWGPHQWPLDVFVADPKDKKLVRENAPMIELMWNLMQVQLPEIVDADNSQSPMGWFRIEHAVCSMTVRRLFTTTRCASASATAASAAAVAAVRNVRQPRRRRIRLATTYRNGTNYLFDGTIYPWH